MIISDLVNGSSEIKSRHVLGFIARRFRDVMSNTFPYSQLSLRAMTYGIL